MEENTDLELQVAKAIALYEERQETARRKEEEEKAKLEKLTEEIESKVRAELEEEKKAWKEAKGSATVIEKSKPGMGVESLRHDFDHWLRTGDYGAAKSLVPAKYATWGPRYDQVLTEDQRKALQEGDATEGGYLVPIDFVAEIVAKRDNYSFVRQMPVRVINTSRDSIEIPAEDTSLTKFSRTAEEASYSTNDPSFAENLVTVHKWTKLTKISEELLEDDATDLMGWYADAVSRAWAQTEAYYVAIGTGTNQHEGIFVGGDTDALTFDSANSIERQEPHELMSKLKSGYLPGSCWLADNLTWHHIATLNDANNWAFGSADNLRFNTGDGAHMGWLYGKKFFVQDDIDAIATSKCTLMFGNPYFYALVERKGLAIKRNPYLYQASGQVGFFSSFRQGGKVLVEESWVGGVQA